MAINNPALYDAVIAGIALCNASWIVSATPADYNQASLAAVAIAIEVDAQILPIANGATISQRDVMASIVKNAFATRNPIDLVPADYLSIAQAIAAMFTSFAANLQDNSTGNSPTGRVLFLTSVADGVIPAYDQLIQESSYTPAAEVNTPIVLAPGATVYLPVSFITPAAIGLPLLQQGEWSFDFFAQTNNNNGVVTLIGEVYARTVPGGVETLLFSAKTPQITTSAGGLPVLYSIDSAQPMFTVNTTDRLVFKVKGNKAGGAGNTTLTFTYEGSNNPSHIHTTLPVA